jgi:hypothetical protein
MVLLLLLFLIVLIDALWLQFENLLQFESFTDLGQIIFLSIDSIKRELTASLTVVID